MTEEITINGYRLTDDSHLLDNENAITPEVSEVLTKAYDIALSGKVTGVMKLKNWVQKYPKTPQFKNYLAVLFESIGEKQKAEDVSVYIFQQHPNYLFGRINLAYQYFKKQKYFEMVDLLGDKVELKDLYPEREVFHIDEYINYMKVSALFFAAIGETDKGQRCIQNIRDIDPESAHAGQAQAEVNLLNLKRAANRKEMENAETFQIEVKAKVPKEKEEEYEFNHKELSKLYQFDTLDNDLLELVHTLPRESVVQDLEGIIDDAIQAYHYGDTFYEQAQGVLHAVLLLTELNHTESLSIILEVFSQDRYFIDEVFEDILTRYIWITFFKLGQNQIRLLQAFMCEPGKHPFIKTEIAKAMEQLYWHYPEREEEVIDWFRGVFDHYISCSLDDNIIDNEMVGLIVAHTVDMQLKELLPQIKQLYSLNYAFPGICGTFESVEDDMLNGQIHGRIEKLSDIKHIYKELSEIYDDLYNFDDDDDFAEEDFMPHIDDEEEEYSTYNPPNINYTNEPIVKEKKIGRNEPCPCGSGKKYKKCCLNK